MEDEASAPQHGIPVAVNHLFTGQVLLAEVFVALAGRAGDDCM